MKNLLLLLLLSSPIFATIEQYNQMIEPIFPHISSHFNIDDLPLKERVLISQAIQEYNTEKKYYDEEFSLAIVDIIHQRDLLRLKLKKVSENASPTTISAFNTVIQEKDSILYNLEMVKYQQDLQLYNHLKLQIITILNQWLQSETRVDPDYVDQLLDTITK